MKYNCKNRVDHVVSTVGKFLIYFAIWCPATKDVSSGVAESLHDMCENWYPQCAQMASLLVDVGGKGKNTRRRRKNEKDFSIIKKALSRGLTMNNQSCSRRA